MSLFDQLTLLLSFVTLALVSILTGLVWKRRALVYNLVRARSDLLASLERNQSKSAYSSDIKSLSVDEILDYLSAKAKPEFHDFKIVASQVPAWLWKYAEQHDKSKLNDRRSWMFFLECSRSNILIATVGSAAALVGASLAATELSLFRALGIAIVIVGLQIVFSVLRDTGIFGGDTLGDKNATVSDETYLRENLK